MKVTRLDLPVMASWMESNGRRLDCNPYLSGGFEAQALLDLIPEENKQELQELTEGGMSGLINAGRITRRWVNDPDHGIPFLSSTDILQADLSTLSLISKKCIQQNPKFLIKKDWILITRSGTIGRIVYARSDMDGMACTEDVLRVIPDRAKILPGYLYAYLSSRFGVALIVSGTYGSIIQHLEPSHIADLPVPRLGDALEQKIHDLITEAALNRVEASKLLAEASQDFIVHFRLEEPKIKQNYDCPSITVATSSRLQQRIDAYYYAGWNEDAEAVFNSVPDHQKMRLEDVTDDLYIPGIFKRLYVSEAKYGYPYITGSDIFCLSPTSNQFLSRKVAHDFRLVLRKGMILVQDSGQLGGLIGRPVAVGSYLDGFSCTNNVVRIIPKTDTDQGYIFAILNTTYGVRLLMREATGSSIPHLDEKRVKNIQIPWADEKDRQRIGKKVLNAVELRDHACDLENQARNLIETQIAKSQF
jgi:type I restriction enzyme, S subunit